MKRLISLLICLTMLMCSLPFASAESTSDRDVIGDGKGVTLKMTVSAVYPDHFHEILQGFYDKTGVSIEMIKIPEDDYSQYFSKIQTMIATGEEPDIFHMYIEGYRIFRDNGMIQPFGDCVERFPEYTEMVKDLHPTLQTNFREGSDIYGYTFDWNTVVTQINTNVLAEAGLEMPPETWTLDDFLAYAQKMTFTREDGTKVYGFEVPSLQFCVSALMFNAGASFLNDDWTECTLNSKESVELMQFLQDCIYKYKVSPVPPVVGGAFMANEIGMVMGGRWLSRSYKVSDFYDVDIQYLPLIKQQQPIYGMSVFPISKNTQHKDEAYQLACWISSSAAQDKMFLDYGACPSTATGLQLVSEQDFPKNSYIYGKSAENSKAIEAPKQFGDMLLTFNRYYSMILANEMDPQAAMDLATEEINQLLSDS